MGNWKIEIEGIGAHDNGTPSCADVIARVALGLLVAHNQNVSKARFVVCQPSGEEIESTDLRADPIDAPLQLERAAPEHIMQFFAWSHLPAHLQAVSRLFGHLAETIVDALPRNPERTVALRKLLEAKDAACRARVAK